MTFDDACKMGLSEKPADADPLFIQASHDVASGRKTVEEAWKWLKKEEAKAMKDGILNRAQQIIARTMANDIGPLFTPDMKLTFAARSTENPDCYLILTDDDLPKVIEVIRRYAETRTPREAEAPAPTGKAT